MNKLHSKSEFTLLVGSLIGLLGVIQSSSAIAQESSTSGWKINPGSIFQRSTGAANQPTPTDSAISPSQSGNSTNHTADNGNVPRPLHVVDRRTVQRIPGQPNLGPTAQVQPASYQSSPNSRVYRTPATDPALGATENFAGQLPPGFNPGMNSLSFEPPFDPPFDPSFEPAIDPRFYDPRFSQEPYLSPRSPEMQSTEQMARPGSPIDRPMPTGPATLGQSDQNADQNRQLGQRFSAESTRRTQAPSFSPPADLFLDQPRVIPSPEHPMFNHQYANPPTEQPVPSRRSPNATAESGYGYSPLEWGNEIGQGYLQQGPRLHGSQLRQRHLTATEVALELQAENQRLVQTLDRIRADNESLQKQLNEQRNRFDRKEQELATAMERIDQLQQRLERREAELMLAIEEKNQIEFRTNEQLKSIEKMLDSVLVDRLGKVTID